MAAKGDFLHGKLDETESLLRLENYYRDLAYGNSVTLQYYSEQNADLFDAWEQTYHDKTYTLYTDSLSLDYALLSQLVSEYDTVAGYGDFLDSVQTKAGQLAGISIFQNDETGYDLKNIEVTAAVCAGLGETAIDYYPTKRSVHCDLLCFHRFDFAGVDARAGAAARAAGAGQRLAVTGSFAARRTTANGAGQARRVCVVAAGRACAAVRRQPRLLRRDVRPRPADPHDPERARPDALHDADHGRAVPVPLFAGQVGRRVCHGAVGHAGGTRCPPGRL